MKQKKQNNIQEKIVNWLNENRNQIIIGVTITLFAFLLRIFFLKHESLDYTLFLKEWFYFIKERNGLPALRYNLGNYNVPYMILLALLTYIAEEPLVPIKMLSIFFDVTLAISCAFLAKELTKSKKVAMLSYGIILFLPMVFLNSAWWGQCDSIYATFVVLSFLYLLKEKYLSSFLLLGIAFAFKLQFIFILPVYLFVYLKKKSFPFYYFFLIPIVNLIFSLPPLVIGRSLEKIMGIYIGQASQYPALSMHYPNVYSFFGKFQTSSGEVLNQTNFPIATIGIIFTFLLFSLLAIWLFRKDKLLNKENLFLLTVWTTLILPFLLPHMHDRYGYLAGIFSILYALIYHKKYYVAIGYQILTIFLYIGGYNEIGNYILSIAHLILVMVFTYQVIAQFIKLTKQQTRERIEEK